MISITQDKPDTKRSTDLGGRPADTGGRPADPGGRPVVVGGRKRKERQAPDGGQGNLRLWLSVLLALALWQVGAVLFRRYMGLGGFLVATPTEVCRRLLALLAEAGFWHRVWFSLCRILSGFFAALAAGSLLAMAAGRFPLLRTFFWPYISVVKSTPVASFVILCLIWVGSANLSAAISFFMVLPIVYSNMLEGIRSTDRKLLEMAEVFRAGWGRRILYIYLPQLKPYLISACSVSLGMTWKAGIAAEVIGIPRGSVGEMLYEAKIYLNATDLFAWTAVIILISAIFEKAFMILLRRAYGRLEAMGNSEQVGGDAQADEERSEAGSERAEAGSVHSEAGSAAAPDAEAGDITVEGLYKAYGDKKVLTAFSAVFPAGKCTCIMGDSGVGKTTLLRILMGLADADAGLVTGLAGCKPAAVFQEDRLCDSFSAVTNVAFACAKTVTRRRIASHLAAVGLGESLRQPVRELSGGMRRRVAVVRAMLAGGQILFLDEPLKGLDEQNKEAVAAYILRHAEGRTILMVTHSLDEAALMGGAVLSMQG